MKSDTDMKRYHTALTIAGSDPSGGAGLQADLKTFSALGVYGSTAVVAVVDENTAGVYGVHPIPVEFVKGQIRSVLSDVGADAVKIGMLHSSELILGVLDTMREYPLLRDVVLDPVMVATSGDRLISEAAVDTLKTCLLPLAAVVTPNIPEAEILAGMDIRNPESIEAAAKQISDAYGCAVLLKGGHNISDANDYLYADGVGTWFYGTHIDNPNTHGTGCTLSSAIAANLAKGFDLPTSIRWSKNYLSGALGAMLDLGKGRGPMQHNFNLTGEYAKEAEQ